MKEDFCLKDYWGYFKDLNNQNNLLGVENFEDALNESIMLLKEKPFLAKKEFDIKSFMEGIEYMKRRIDTILGDEFANVLEGEQHE